MEKLYTIRDACKILQIHPTTLRMWDREGKIRCVRMQNNFRRVPESEINRILGIQDGRVSYIYARVSSNGQKEDLERQIIHLKSFSPESEVISDIRSGMRFDRKGFLKLLSEI
jgi:putative resolvase